MRMKGYYLTKELFVFLNMTLKGSLKQRPHLMTVPVHFSMKRITVFQDDRGV